MKALITIITLAASFTFSSVGAATTSGGEDEKAIVIQEVSSLVNSAEVVKALGIEGSADISISIDENGVAHVEKIETANYALEYHIRQSVEGAKLAVKDSLIGKSFTFVMNIVQSK